MISRILASLLLINALVLSAQANDIVPLIDLNVETDVSETPGPGQFDGVQYTTHFNNSIGWTFYVYSPIKVTHVAWYDENGDGLSHAHRIGLWKDLSGETFWPYIGNSPTPEQLLFTPVPFLPDVEGVEIPSGTLGELVDGWRRVPLPSPITLTPGGYVLGGENNENSTDSTWIVEDFLAGEELGNSLPADPRIQIGGPAVSIPSNGFGIPDGVLLIGGVNLGPMLFIESIPEPTSLALVGLASLGLLSKRRRKST